jgi:hypothetical protein
MIEGILFPLRTGDGTKMANVRISEVGRLNDPSCWYECYPPDFDHGGEPLLGGDPNIWKNILKEAAFVAAECSAAGRLVVVVAQVRGGFVEVHGQHVGEGEPLSGDIAEILKGAHFRIPVDPEASTSLGLAVEIDTTDESDWRAVAQKIEVHLLSTISRLAAFGNMKR